MKENNRFLETEEGKKYFDPALQPEINDPLNIAYRAMQEAIRSHVIFNAFKSLDTLYNEIWCLDATVNYLTIGNSPIYKMTVRSCFQNAIRAYVDHKAHREWHKEQQKK